MVKAFTNRYAIGRDSWLLILAEGVSALPTGYLTVALPIYLTAIGLSPALVGGVYTISGLASGLLMGPAGVLADRLGRKRLLLLGYALPAFAYALVIISAHPLVISVAAALGGFGMSRGTGGALATASGGAWLAERSGDERRTAALALQQVLYNAGVAFGALSGGTPRWLAAVGVDLLTAYRGMFVAALACMVVALMLVLGVPETFTARPAREAWWRIPERSAGIIARLCAWRILFGVGSGFIIEMLSLWFLLRYGAGEDKTAPWFFASEALSILVVPMTPLLASRLGLRRSLLIVMSLGASFMAAIPVASTYQGAALLYIARNTFFNVWWPLQFSYTMGIVPPDARGTAAGFTNAMHVLGLALVPPISGALLQRGMLTVPFLLSAAAYALGTLVFTALVARRRPAEEQALADA